jgi:catechol 2,3-dioxygenase-like lactoylglutathione lyase family enzyme
VISVQHLDHVAMTVSNLERSTEWYKDLLGLERRYQQYTGDDLAMLWAGETSYLALFRATPEQAHLKASRQELSMQHFAFRVDRKNFDRAFQELESRGIEYRLVTREITHALYFFDPDGYELEVATYELE